MTTRIVVTACCLLLSSGACSSSGSGGASSGHDSGVVDSQGVEDASADAAGPLDAAATSDAGEEPGSSSADATSEASQDASTPADGSGSTGPGCLSGTPLQCGAPSQCGPVVQVVASSQAPPAPTGGDIVPGMYVLTSAVSYGSQQGGLPTYQFTLQIAGSMFYEATYVGGYEQSPISGTFTTSGTTLVRNVTCTISETLQGGYSASATSLTTYRTSGGDTIAEVYSLE